jgi:hypothetical protein
VAQGVVLLPTSQVAQRVAEIPKQPEQPAFESVRWPRFGDGFGSFCKGPSVKSLTPKWVWVVLIRIDFG